MLGLFAGIGRVFLTLNALIQCIRARFAVGIIGAIVHAAFVAIGSVVGLIRSFAGSNAPPLHPVLAAMVLSIPAVSFGVLWMAHRRARNVPAAQEKEASRPFDAWLPVGIVDAIFVVIAIAASAVSDPW